MTRHKTSKELEAENKAQSESAAVRRAREVLYALMQAKGDLERAGGREARKCIDDLDARISWLIEESETYRDVAAEFWRKRVTAQPMDQAGEHPMERR